MKIRLFRLAQWAAIITLVVALVRGMGQVVKLWRAGDIVKQTEKQIVAETQSQQQLQQQLQEVQSDAYVEREARDKLGYATEGETIVVILDQNDKNNQYSVSNNQLPEKTPNWKQWWELWLGF